MTTVLKRQVNGRSSPKDDKLHSLTDIRVSDLFTIIWLEIVRRDFVKNKFYLQNGRTVVSHVERMASIAMLGNPEKLTDSDLLL